MNSSSSLLIMWEFLNIPDASIFGDHSIDQRWLISCCQTPTSMISDYWLSRLRVMGIVYLYILFILTHFKLFNFNFKWSGRRRKCLSRLTLPKRRSKPLASKLQSTCPSCLLPCRTLCLFILLWGQHRPKC